MSEATLYQFQQKGIIIVSGQSISDKAKALEIAITIGAEDVYAFHDDFDEDCFKFICDTQVVAWYTYGIVSWLPQYCIINCVFFMLSKF